MNTASLRFLKSVVKLSVKDSVGEPPQWDGRGASHYEPDIARVVRPGWGSVRDQEMLLLKELVEATNHCSGPIIEIGTLLGSTTTWLAVWNASPRKVITVDNYSWNPWTYRPEDHLALTRQVLLYLVQTGRVEQINMDKNRFYKKYRGLVPSLVFLDAIHDYPETKNDIEWAKSVNAGVITGHDYCDTFPGVKRAVDEFGGPRRQAGSVWCL